MDFDGRHEYSDVVSVFAVDKRGKEVTISPNPSYDIIYIQSESESTFHIYNSMGKYIQTFPIKEGKNEIDLQGLQAGMYILYFDKLNIKNESGDFYRVVKV